MARPGGRQPVDALQQRVEVGEILAGTAGERLSQAQIPCQVKPRAGQARHRSCHIASPARGHPTKHHRHQGCLHAGDGEHLDEYQRQNEHEVDGGSTRPSADSQDHRQKDRADEQVGGHREGQPRGEDIDGADRRKRQQQKVAADKERGDHSGEPDDEHQDRKPGEAADEERVDSSRKKVSRAGAETEGAATDEYSGCDQEDRQHCQARGSSLHQAMSQRQDLDAEDGPRRRQRAHASRRSMSSFASGPAVSFKKSSSRLACSLPAWARSSSMVPVAVMRPRSMMATRRHSACATSRM